VTGEEVARAIQLILAPVVMISSAAVLLNGLLTHYGEVNSRIRAMNRERFEMAHLRAAGGGDTHLIDERLAQIDHQVPDLLDRHRVIHDAMLTVYYAIAILVASMLVVAAAVLTNLAWVAAAVLALLLLGTLVLLYGVVLITQEIRGSRRSIVYESQWALHDAARHAAVASEQPGSLRP
jgi:VIT1/CCC1 family predicted Fe2+/Mn2+ transporter